MDLLTLRLFAVFMLSVAGCSSGQDAPPPEPLIKAVGESVTFTPNINSTIPDGSISWNFIDGSESKLIINSAPGGSTPGPGYEGRVSVNRNTASLELRELTLRDTGVYKVQLISSTGAQLTDKFTLKVYEPVSNVTVRTNATDFVEFNDTVSLICSANGSSLLYRWHNGSADITASERIHLSDDNRTLTISSVLRSDRGPLYCTVYNGISNETSQPIFLNISYGPEDVVINGDIEVEVSRMVVLICSASSVPPPAFTWTFSGTETNVTTAKYTVENAMYGDSGNYACVAENALTGLTKSSAVHVLTVTAPYHGPPLEAILGGVFGALACVGLVAAVVILMLKKKKKKSSSGTCTSDRSTSTQQRNAGELELAYADISHFKKADSGKVQLGGPVTVSAQVTLKLGQATTERQETLYAEVRNA